VFNVEHGCGNEPTTAIRIRLDERIVSAKAIEKPGWQVQLTGVPSGGGGCAAMPRGVSWTGGSLPARSSATFAIDVRLPSGQPGTVIYFPLVQECGRVSVRWIETPLPGERPDSLEYPAPFVTLTNALSSSGAAH
jgi:periplasmic copper chaperone A